VLLDCKIPRVGTLTGTLLWAASHVGYPHLRWELIRNASVVVQYPYKVPYFVSKGSKGTREQDAPSSS